MYRILPYLLLSLVACSLEEDPVDTVGLPSIAVSEVVPNTLAQIRDDMLLPHEAAPRGVPETLDWYSGPRRGYGNHPPKDWSATITWGQVYAAANSTPPENTRFQIKNLRTWYLSKASGNWVNWQTSSRVDGANYAEDFQQDRNEPADLRPEAEGVSATVRPGTNFHFWPEEGRVTMDPADIEAVWTAIDARLILQDSSKRDDRAEARLLLSAGADYWLNLSAPWDEWKTNGDVGIGRFRFLTPDWQTFNMHTMSDSILANYPPPFN